MKRLSEAVVRIDREGGALVVQYLAFSAGIDVPTVRHSVQEIGGSSGS